MTVASWDHKQCLRVVGRPNSRFHGASLCPLMLLSTGGALGEGTAYSRWSSILSTFLLGHLGVHPRLLGFAMVPLPSGELSSRPVGDTVCPEPSMPWLLLNNGPLGSPHLPARITVYWVLLDLKSYALAPCQDPHPPRGAGLSEGGLVEAADSAANSAH